MTEKANPFDFYNDASYAKLDITKGESNIGSYIPYLTNRAFSYHPDTIFYANEMNIRQNLDKMMQYHYYMFGVEKRKRYSGKWHKNELTADVEVIMSYYSVNREVAKKYLKVLSKDQLKEIKERMNPGGTK